MVEGMEDENTDVRTVVDVEFASTVKTEANVKTVVKVEFASAASSQRAVKECGGSQLCQRKLKDNCKDCGGNFW